MIHTITPKHDPRPIVPGFHWFASCSCGWTSVARGTVTAALCEGNEHTGEAA